MATGGRARLGNSILLLNLVNFIYQINYDGIHLYGMCYVIKIKGAFPNIKPENASSVSL